MSTTDEDRLWSRLERTPYLIIDCSSAQASLVAEETMLRSMGSTTHFVINAKAGYDNFRKLAKEQTQFSLTDISKVAGVEYHAAHFWMREGIITPSIQEAGGSGRGRGPIFSFADAFAAGIIGSMRRQGIGLDVLKRVAPLFEKRISAKSSPPRKS